VEVETAIPCAQSHWRPAGSLAWGDRTTDRFLPNGTKVDHDNNPIPFGVVAGVAAGTAVGVITVDQLLEGLVFAAFAF